MSDVEFDSIRTVHPTHIRGGMGNIISAGGPRRLVFHAEPFAHVEVLPSGELVPMVNIASVVPAGSGMAGKFRKSASATPKVTGPAPKKPAKETRSRDTDWKKKAEPDAAE